MTLYGVDLSDYDHDRGPVDVASMARAGMSFLTHKATEGTTVVHRHYGGVLNAARSVGIGLLGGYHVVRSVDVHAQVRAYLNYLDQATPWWHQHPGFFHQVDLERWEYDAVTATTGLNFVRALQAAQPKRVILYASRGQYGDSLAGAPCPLWNADYSYNNAGLYWQLYPGDNWTNDTAGRPRGWHAYSGQTPALLQYGSQATIGSQRGCDINAFRGTMAQLHDLLTGGIMTDPNTAPIDDTAFQTARLIAIGATRDGYAPAGGLGWVAKVAPELRRYNLEALSGQLDAIGAAVAKIPTAPPAPTGPVAAVDGAAFVAALLANPVAMQTLAGAIAAAIAGAMVDELVSMAASMAVHQPTTGGPSPV